MVKYYRRLASKAFVRQPVLEKKNSEFKPPVFRLEIELVLHLTRGGRIG